MLKCVNKYKIDFYIYMYYIHNLKMKYTCLCNTSFTVKYDYYEHKKKCKCDVVQSFQTLRMYIHSLDYKARKMKEKIYKQS